MGKRIKRLIKQKQGLLNQVRKHEQKLKTEKGSKDTTHEYWEKEIIQFKNRAKERNEIIKRLQKKK